MIVSRDPAAEAALFWRVVMEMRAGAMSREEAFDELALLAKNTDQAGIRLRCLEVLAGDIGAADAAVHGVPGATA